MDTKDNEVILACDENGNFLGEYIPKSVGHSGLGKRHLAITVLLYNSEGKVLLQKRKHKIFDNIWDLTGATHLLHKTDDSDEDYIDATARCLKQEYGIESLDLKKLGSFNYFARDGKMCEKEHCFMITGLYNGAVKLNPVVGYECKWVDKKDFLTDIEQNPKKYSPWATEAKEILKEKGFFEEIK